jgi:hypothetical protein
VRRLVNAPQLEENVKDHLSRKGAKKHVNKWFSEVHGLPPTWNLFNTAASTFRFAQSVKGIFLR